MEQAEAANIEVRFDSFTFTDLPESEQELLRSIFNASPMVATTRINPKPRNEELDEQFFAKYGRPRPKGGLHGGLGEGVYIVSVRPTQVSREQRPSGLG
jgi:hypothetical protein